jgi:hypothetical protein
VKNINKSNELRKKNLIIRKISIFEMISSLICIFKKKDKYQILDKCKEFADTTFNLNYVINKLFEINFIKHLILKEKEYRIFDHQKDKYINLSNLEKAEEYLDSLNSLVQDHKFDLENYENIKNSSIGIREKLLISMMNKFD